MEILQDTSISEFFKDSPPIAIPLDKSYSYLSPVNNPHDIEIRKPAKFFWLGINELNVLMEGNITIQNKNYDLSYEDIAIKIRVKTYDKFHKETVLHDFFVEPPYIQTGKGEVQKDVRKFQRNIAVPAFGKFYIEVFCNKVYSYNEGGHDARYSGKFDIINNSNIVLTKQG